MSLTHDFPFDPTYGYDLAELLAVEPPPEPEGFAAFWQQTYRETMATPPKPRAVEVESRSQSHRLFEVEYTGRGGFRVGGWLVLPRDEPVACGFVVGHGYGGREAPEYVFPAPGAAALQPCARGFYRSARPGLPHDAMTHVVFGIERREDYILRDCVADLWSATSALLELAPEVGDRLFYSGGSFGGGLGAMALPWEPRWRRAFLSVPTFGCHPLRLTMPCVGSGEAVRRYHAEHPEVTEVLTWYDAAIHAAHTRVPVLTAPAQFDPAVPPPGQFAVHNAQAGASALFVRTAGHFENPNELAEARELARLQREFFAGE